MTHSDLRCHWSEREQTHSIFWHVQDPWGWIDPDTGVYHALTHDGNGLRSAGGHDWVRCRVSRAQCNVGPCGLGAGHSIATVVLRQAYPNQVNARWHNTGVAYTGQVY